MTRAFIVIIALFAGAFAHAQYAPVSQAPPIPPAKAVLARNGMVVAPERRAANIGVEILKRGGNAIDAAVAVGFALAVTYPRAGNLGGGGFMVIHAAKDNRNTAIDYRETAPSAAAATMFLDANGNADPAKSRDSALGIGVPGTVAGLALAERNYGSGKFSLAELIAPALELARSGFAVDADLAGSLASARQRLARWPSTSGLFVNNGDPLHEGDSLVQPDLAATLQAIAQDGPTAFYTGPISARIADAVAAAGGIMTADDLGHYRALERPAITGTYRGYTIVSMPPPSSGGVALVEMLNVLEGYDLGRLGRGEQSLHYFIEAMKRAYADRAVFMGDPDTVKIPIAGMISKQYAAVLRAGIGETSTPAADIHAGKPAEYEGRNTTHYSVVDRDGNAVSNTTTLNFYYGVGLVAAGTGVLLNNELDDFTAKPGAANAYGLVGFDSNLPGPGKRPLSSMTPTVVLKDARPFLITGSPGGSRIITAVLDVITNVIDFHMPVDQAVGAPRLHNQWQPDETYAEPGFAPGVIEALEKRGHKIEPTGPHTAANSIAVTADGYVGAADPRTPGAVAVGY
jgi:gamma-glutamyltranspeptidase/glutathione hydrolase